MLLLISRLIAFPLLEYLAWRYLRKPYLELQDAVKKGWGVLAGMIVLYYMLLYLAGGHCGRDNCDPCYAKEEGGRGE